MLHQEINGIAGFTAAKTFVNAFGCGNGKGRSFFIVKRTKPYQVNASFFQRNKITYHFLYPCSFDDALYGVFVDQNVIICLC